MYEDEIHLAFLLFLRPILTNVRNNDEPFEAHYADQGTLLNDFIVSLPSLVWKIATSTGHVDVLVSKPKRY